jgi:UDP-N-acetyl-D-mannosaminuronate dehydrogenase
MSNAGAHFLEKVRTKCVSVAVISLGYVGLPLGTSFGRAGVRVIGLDVNPERVATINRGVSHIPDVPTEIMAPLVQAGLLSATTDYSVCAQRIDPGTKQLSPHNTPKVVGGIDDASTEATVALFGLLVPPEQIHRVSGPRVAEMCKLLETIFRGVNIALVNELTKLCHRMGIDIWEVIDAAAAKPFGCMPFYPGPGVGGHCIPVDPYYLSWKAQGAEVAYPDPHVPEVSLEDGHGGGQASGPRLRSVLLTDQALGAQDCVCLAVAHTAFDLPWVITHSRLIVDAAGATRRGPHAPASVVRL